MNDQSVKFNLRYECVGSTITIALDAMDLAWKGLKPFVRIMDGDTIREIACHVESKTQAVASDIAALVVVLDWRTTDQGWLELTFTIKNEGNSDVAIVGYGLLIEENKEHGIFCRQSSKNVPVYAHTDNLRHEYLPQSRWTFPYIRSFPEESRWLSRPGAGAVPCIAFGELDANAWLLEGALSNRKHTLQWEVGHGFQPIRKSLFTWNGGGVVNLRSGEHCVGESIGFYAYTGPADQLLKPYFDVVSHRIDAAGKSSVLASKPVFCTWNYGVFTDVNEADCVRRMETIAPYHAGGFFQIDHAYQPSEDNGEILPDLDCWYPEPKGAWDPVRFPSGPTGFVELIKEWEMIPALWWSPRVGRAGRIATQHPEWLLLDSKRRPIDVGHFMLDCSVIEVRTFIECCLDAMLVDWGFCGLKLDFFSYMFDHRDVIYRNGGTGVEWKRWLFSAIRKRLGPQGYFLHCISCPSGDPWLSDNGPDAYRAGMDIHLGAWSEHRRNMHWMWPAGAVAGKQSWFPNIDSCLGDSDISEHERRSRMSIAYMTGGVIEISGRPETYSDEMFQDYKHLIERMDQGNGFSCLGEEAYYGRPFPEVIVRKHVPGSWTYDELSILGTIGIYNWTDKPRTITVEMPADYADCPNRDFWTRENYSKTILSGVIALKSREHRMIDFYLD